MKTVRGDAVWLKLKEGLLLQQSITPGLEPGLEPVLSCSLHVQVRAHTEIWQHPNCPFIHACTW